MMQKLKRGLFITFEGPEGVGKSTQASLLVDRLREEYAGVIQTREPGGTSLGKKLRALLLHSDETIFPAAELFMMMADRAQHVAELIRPALEEGQIVVCDRYVDSTIAYQGWGRGWDVRTLWKLHEIAAEDLMPDLTLVLTGEPHRERGDDRFERLDNTFHNNVEAAYQHLTNVAERCVKVWGGGSREAVSRVVWEQVYPLLVQRL